VRSFEQLVRTAEYDGRFYLNTIKDWGPRQNHGIWIAGLEPTLVRENGQVVGLRPMAYSQCIRTTNNVTVNQENTIEFSVKIHSDLPFPGAPGSVYLGGVGGSGPLLQILGINRIGVTWGVTLFSTNNNVFKESVPCTILATRDSGDVGHLYADGVPVGEGNVGGGVGSGNVLSACGFTNLYTAVATTYSIRMLDTHVTPEEASLLYEHTRVQLAGAKKKSGIMSVR